MSIYNIFILFLYSTLAFSQPEFEPEPEPGTYIDSLGEEDPHLKDLLNMFDSKDHETLCDVKLECLDDNDILSHIPSDIALSLTELLMSPAAFAPFEAEDQKKENILLQKTQKKKSMCTVLNCTKFDKGGGLCSRHGGGKRCEFQGCTKSVKSKGLCVRHGGGKRCEFQDCTKGAKEFGLCAKHGGIKLCNIKGCARPSKRLGVCFRHGGKSLCQVPSCSKSVKSKGLCARHGGGKRCLVQKCTKLIKKDDLCATHLKQKTDSSASHQKIFMR